MRREHTTSLARCERARGASQVGHQGQRRLADPFVDCFRHLGHLVDLKSPNDRVLSHAIFILFFLLSTKTSFLNVRSMASCALESVLLRVGVAVDGFLLD